MRHDQNSNFSCGLAVVYICVCGCELQATALFGSCAAWGSQCREGGVISAGVHFPVEHRSGDGSGAVCWSTQIGELGGVIASCPENLLHLTPSVTEYSPEHLEALVF